ncbi:MAG: gliding motility-associated C-terminal domain-containing protein [Bacteroidota bacterium]
MKIMRRLFFLIVACFFSISFENSSPLVDEEICDNALDDDMDGLIDLNDPDCDCPEFEALSLIPNPSFEDTLCCPQSAAELNCAAAWIQASEPTTDFVHSCGWYGWAPPPAPFPDGEGCIGFRNGRPNATSGQPEWKEYCGACLSGPLEVGRAYRLEFYIGFSWADRSPPTDIAVYGAADCASLPFGSGNILFGCPTNGPDWVELDQLSVSGEMEWQKKEVDLIPDFNISAIAIGPTCEHAANVDNYYFLDKLVLAPAELFDFKVQTTSHPCNEELQMEIPFSDTLQYQWYKDGIALIGETGHVLQNPAGEGIYQVKVEGANSCFITDVFNFVIPVFASDTIETTLCFGEQFIFNQELITESGFYVDTLKTVDGCDSLVFLDLNILDENSDTVRAVIFEGESFTVADRPFTEVGEYLNVLDAYTGCDSLVHLFLDVYKIFIPSAFSPNNDGINDLFTIYSNIETETLKSVEIFDRWGGLVFREQNIFPNNFSFSWDGKIKRETAGVGTYVYKVVVALQDGKEKKFFGTLVLLR